MVRVQRQSHLAEIRRAFRPLGRRPDFLDAREQQRDQNGNDGDNDQELDQGERRGLS